MTKTKATRAGWLGTLALGVALAGCSSSGSKAGSTGSQSVTGVATASGPVSGTVSLKDSSSPPVQRTATTAADGTYWIDATVLTAPYLLRAVGSGPSGASVGFSLADRPGVADINLLTDLAVTGAVAGRTPQAEFDGSGGGAGGGDGQRTTSRRLGALLTQLRTVLAPLFDLYGVSDPRTDRAAVRAMLADVSFSLSGGVVTVTNRASGGVIFAGPLTDLASGTFHAENLPGGPGGGPPSDGVALYESSCSSCHGALASSSVRGASASAIRTAINANTGGMGSLAGLSASDLTAISLALSGATTGGGGGGGGGGSDGAALYTANCASCHGALASSQVGGASASQIQNAINGNTGGMGRLSGLTSAQVAAIASALSGTTGGGGGDDGDEGGGTGGGGGGGGGSDGAALYSTSCQGCHGPLATSQVRGASAGEIRSAINENEGGMGVLSGLTSAQLTAISAALSGATSTGGGGGGGGGTPDGTALYAQYCAGCHGTSKKGRSASAIQGAIDNNTGGMGSLSSLTAAQIAAIAAAP